MAKEPYWLPDDQDKALAWNRRQRELCSGCGTHSDEWKDDPDAYVGWLESCKGCERLEAENSNIPDGKASPAIKRFLVPRAIAERMMAQGNTGAVS